VPPAHLAGGRRDPRAERRVEQEVLPERLPRLQPVARDRVAERGQRRQR